jgi:aspartate/methionine/tyrosine aminotransferase
MPIEVESPEELGYNNIRYNLAESSVRDLSWNDLGLSFDELVLCYGEHRGSLQLRKEIIHSQPSLLDSDVLVTPSAATALFIIHTALLDVNSHLIVLRPNYATNIETPFAIGCDVTYIDFSLENNYFLDIEKIFQAVKPTTKLISITTPHNPSGKIIDSSTIRILGDLCENKGIYLLVDETYRDLQWEGSPVPDYAATFGNHIISVSSLSKAYGVPGIRTGWIISKNIAIMEMFLAAKEQILICNSVLDEAVALHVLEHKNNILGRTLKYLPQNFGILKNWISTQDIIEWSAPEAGVVAFPRIVSNVNIDLGRMYNVLYQDYRTVVGPGHWFGCTDNYMRIGFGFPTPDELEMGLENISKSIEKSTLL